MTKKNTSLREQDMHIRPGDESPNLGICEEIARLVKEGQKARAASLLADQIIHPQCPNAQPDAPLILCMSRDRFWLDMAQLIANGRFNYCYLNKPYYDAFVQSIPHPNLEKNRIRQTLYAPDTSPEVLAHKQNSLPFAREFLQQVKHRWPQIRAILTANLDYWENWMIEQVRDEFRLKILTLSREHYVSKYLRDLKIDTLRKTGFRYQGDGVAFFGEMSLPVYLDTGSLDPALARVTGAPRMDVWRSYQPDPSRMNNITILAFSGRKYNATGAYPETLRILEKSSRSLWRQHLIHIVKCKDGNQRQFTQQHLSGQSRVKIKLGDIFDVLRHSRLVVGTNSLALLEALLCDATLAVPYWADARQTPDQMVISPEDELARKHITFCQSPRELENLMARIARQKPQTLDPDTRRDRLTLFRRYFHFPEDKTCTQCVEDFIAEFVNL